jgi:short-subunit dehydrogenase
MRAVITGASSGIGQELARELSRRGWELVLLARRVDLIEKLPRSEAVECDVTDAESVRAAVSGPFDLAVANAGVSIPNHAAKFNLADAERVLTVNVFGMLNLYDAVIPGMVERRSGRFAGIASLAGLRGLPSAAPYSASKAAMQAFLEASRVELAHYGVGVTIVNPGFVTTPMTAKNKFRMPFLMTAARAAKIIADGLERGKRVIEFPRGSSLMMRAMRHLPDPLYDRVLRSAGRKPR